MQSNENKNNFFISIILFIISASITKIKIKNRIRRNDLNMGLFSNVESAILAYIYSDDKN